MYSNGGIKMKNATAIGAALAALVGIVGVPYCASEINYSEGNRVGTIHKFSEKGYIFKTHEGQLGLEAGDSAAMGRGNWSFSVADENLAQRVEAAMNGGERVRVTYQEKLLVPFWIGDTKYLATDITPISKR